MSESVDQVKTFEYWEVPNGVNVYCNRHPDNAQAIDKLNRLKVNPSAFYSDSKGKSIGFHWLLTGGEVTLKKLKLNPHFVQ